jgi:hypothetical protein
MADTKISALTAATTPLAGTEVLPIVQSGTTKKVAVSDLTAGRNVSADSLKTGSGALSSWSTASKPVEVGAYSLAIAEQNSGSGLFTWNLYQDTAGSFVYKTNNPGLLLQMNATGLFNFYTAPSGTAGAAASLTQVLSVATDVTVNAGNLVIGTNGKGIDFSATPGTGTSELFDDYEEGTFTPTVAGSTTAGTGTYTARNGVYTKIGNTVYFQIDYILSAHTGTGDTLITGLPFTSGGAYYTNIVTSAQNLALTALYYIGGSIIAPADTKIYLQQMPVGGGSAIGIPIDPVCDVRLSGFYFV